MITAAISAIVGIVGGVIPDIAKEIIDSREHDREIERMEKTADIQVKLIQYKTDAKLAEIDGNIVVEEMRAFTKQMANLYKLQKPTGIRFVDGFNALLRPTTAALVMVMFFVIATMYAVGVIGELGASNMQTVAQVLWQSMIGESIQAVLGYLFGYRTTKGRISEVRARFLAR